MACVIGCGFVGEALVHVLKKEFDVVAYDVSPQRVQSLVAQGINATSDARVALSGAQLIAVCVPTGVNEDKSVDVRALLAARNDIAQHATQGATIVVESSVYIGATRELFGSLRDRFYIGMSPERIDPGRTDVQHDAMAKIYSAIDEESVQKVVEMYGKVFKNLVYVSTLETAEMCKLFENCFRAVNIAYVNEASDVCEKFGISCNEMVRACATKPYGFMPFWPSAGVGGHCIPNNPVYFWHGLDKEALPLLRHAWRANNLRPCVYAEKLMHDYPDAQRYLVVGLGFKKGESVVANSPGLGVADALAQAGKDVFVYDPLVQADTTQSALVSYPFALCDQGTDLQVDVVFNAQSTVATKAWTKHI